MQSSDELRMSIRSKCLQLKRQQEELKESEVCGGAIRKRLTDVMKRVTSHQDKSEKLMHDKAALEEALRLREVEIEILQDSRRKERSYLIALREEEVAEYRKQLDSVQRELKEEREKIPPLKEEIQQLLVELAKKSEEIRHLMSAKEETQSQLKLERERVEMKTNELTAAAVSKAEYMKEVQVRVSCELDINMCGFTFPVCMYTSCTDAVSIT